MSLLDPTHNVSFKLSGASLSSLNVDWSQVVDYQSLLSILHSRPCVSFDFLKFVWKNKIRVSCFCVERRLHAAANVDRARPRAKRSDGVRELFCLCVFRLFTLLYLIHVYRSSSSSATTTGVVREVVSRNVRIWNQNGIAPVTSN